MHEGKGTCCTCFEEVLPEKIWNRVDIGEVTHDICYRCNENGFTFRRHGGIYEIAVYEGTPAAVQSPYPRIARRGRIPVAIAS